MKWTSQKPIKACDHVLISNDFPPKVGGIQNYLMEIYRRLPSDRICVITTSYDNDKDYDQELDFPVVRLARKVLLPTPSLVIELNKLLKILNPKTVALDPLLPLGLVSPWLIKDVTFLVWGAEVVIPASLFGVRSIVAKLLRGSQGVVSGGQYALDVLNGLSKANLPRSTVVHPGVDIARFTPVPQATKDQIRAKFGILPSDIVLLGVSRLVPRKGMDTLIKASAIARKEIPNLKLIVAGDGRQRPSLEKLASRFGIPVRFWGKVSNEDLVALYRASDVFAMLCRSRWWGLEQEGFGIVFIEAAACGVTALAGDSGGASEAVLDAVTGFVISEPKDATAVALRLKEIVHNSQLRSKMSANALERVRNEFAYEVIARKYGEFFDLMG